MSRSIWFTLPVLSTLLLPLIGAPAPRNEKPVIEIVFCLDTTGSLGGMLDGVRKSFWSICKEALSAKPLPELKVGVVAFRDKGDEYVSKVFDLSDDLDAVFLTLRDLSAAGGGDTPEHVNQGLFDSVNQISWSRAENAVRMIYLAGDAAPHMDYTDDVPYPVTCKKAVEKGIAIHALQCGHDGECAKHFAQIARLGKGTHVVLPLDGGVEIATTPVDKRLAEIHAELTRGTVVYGTAAQRSSNAKKVSAALELPPASAADRVSVLAKLGRVARYDLIDATRAGQLTCSELPEDAYEPALRKLTLAERKAHLERVGKRRAELLLEAHEREKERAEVLSRKQERNRASFDAQVVELLRKHAGRKLRY